MTVCMELILWNLLASTTEMERKSFHVYPNAWLNRNLTFGQVPFEGQFDYNCKDSVVLNHTGASLRNAGMRIACKQAHVWHAGGESHQNHTRASEKVSLTFLPARTWFLRLSLLAHGAQTWARKLAKTTGETCSTVKKIVKRHAIPGSSNRLFMLFFPLYLLQHITLYVLWRVRRIPRASV